MRNKKTLQDECPICYVHAMLRIHWVELFHILATSQRLHGIENVTTTFINKVMKDQWQYLFWINSPFKEMSAEAAKARRGIGNREKHKQ